jgi:hypothetical protein
MAWGSLDLPELELTLVHFPKTPLLTSKLEQAVFGIVPLAASRAGNEAANVHPLAIVFFGNGERCAATARHKVHLQIGCWRIGWWGILPGHG